MSDKKIKYVKIDEENLLDETPKSNSLKPALSKNKKSAKKKTKTVFSVIGTTFLSIVLIFVITGCIVATALTVYVMQFADDTFNIDLKNVDLSYTSFVYAYDSEGKEVEIKRLSKDVNRIWADISDIPKSVQDAFVSVEDQRFYEHEGVDWKRTMKVTMEALFKGYGEGGSTITQQLIKNITGDSSVNAERKLREIFRALSMETKYTKFDILEAYLNRIPLGGTVYGVGSAAYYYFNKTIDQLTIAEAAILAGVTRSPGVLNPYADLQASKDKQLYALKCMYEQGYITTAEYEAAKVEKVKFRLIVEGDAYGYVDERYEEYYGNNEDSDDDIDEDTYEAYKWDEYELSQNWYVDAGINQAIADLADLKGITEEEATDLLYRGGFKIYLNMNMDLQNTIEEKFKDPNVFLHSYDKEAKERDLVQAGFVLMDYHGKVLACAGGIGDKPGDGCFNRATQAILPIGSTMKPISVYAPAIDKNTINYSTKLYDKSLVLTEGDGSTYNWPQNYETDYGSGNYYSTWYAVQQSKNTIAVRVCELNTLDACYNFLVNKLGISQGINKGLVDEDRQYLSSIALGQTTYGINLTELCASYQIFGNNGTFYKPMYYSKILDNRNNVILEEDAIGTKAIDSDSAYIMNRLLSTVINTPNGSGQYAKLGNVDVVGKTGTSNDGRILAFMGLTPQYVGAYRIGFDDGREIDSSWKTLADVWRDIMDDFVDTNETQTFTADQNVVSKEYCDETGLLATSKCPGKSIGFYKKDALPAICDSDHDGSYWQIRGGDTLAKTG